MQRSQTLTMLGGALALAVTACSGGTKGDSAAPPAEPPDMPETPAPKQVEPLGIGGDYETYTKVNTESFFSPTHGKRMVDVWVNDVGLAAYTSDAELPPGSILVKTSWERDPETEKATDVAGPIFVMEKREEGYAPDQEDWYYAIHWANPTPAFAKKFGGGIYWQSPDAKVSYCWECHENYDRSLGLPPREFRTWEQNGD